MAFHEIFISYRREKGSELAIAIREKLHSKGYHVFLDREDLRMGRFDDQLLVKIEKAIDFLVILTPGSLDRTVNEDDWVRKEIEYAFKCEKNIVPIFHRDFRWPEFELPGDLETLRNHQGLAPNYDDFHASIMKLLTLLRSTKRRNRRAAIRITTGVILFGLILSLITLNAIHSFDDIKGLEELPTDAELEEQAKPERPEIPKPITVHDLFKRTDSTIIEAEDL